MLANTAMKLSRIGSAPVARLPRHHVHHATRVRLHHLLCCALIVVIWLIVVSESGTQFSAISVRKQVCQSWSFCIKMNQAGLPEVTNQHHPFHTLFLNSCIFHAHLITLCTVCVQPSTNMGRERLIKAHAHTWNMAAGAGTRA